MALDAKKHATIAPGELPTRAAIAAAIFSIDDIIPVANATEANQVATAIAAAGQVLASNPVFVSRADARGLHRIEYSYDGSVWLPASGVLAFASKNAADTFGSANSALLTAGDICLVGNKKYVWYTTPNEWLPDRPAFLARRANAQTVASAGWTVLAAAFGTPDYNELGTWSAANGTITVARAGLYRIALAVGLTSATNPTSIQVTRNSTGPDGVTSLGSALIGASGQDLAIDVMADLAANDAIRGLFYTSVANSIRTDGPRNAILSLELVRAA